MLGTRTSGAALGERESERLAEPRVATRHDGVLPREREEVESERSRFPWPWTRIAVADELSHYSPL